MQLLNNDKQYTILLVDDNPSNLNLLVDGLFEQGFQLNVAKSGESALQRAHIRKPDIVLLDVQMPGIDGFETCRQFKADPELSSIPIIFLTASNEASDRRQGLLAGGVDYIVKPLDTHEVLLRVRIHLELQRLNRELEHSNAELERRVVERTKELSAEVERRAHSEKRQTVLLDIVRTQGVQLQFLTKRILAMQLSHRTALGEELNDEVVHDLTRITAEMPRLLAQISSVKMRDQLNAVSERLQRIQHFIIEVTDALKQPLPEEITLVGNPLLKLSQRERETLQLIVNEYSSDEIAELLNVSGSTVRTYRYRILQKLGVKNTDELLKFVLAHKLFED